MTTLTCLPEAKSFEARAGETILEATLRAGMPHAHACGGHAKCTTCRIVVLQGLEGCPPRNGSEQVLAARLRFAPEVRLACQTRPAGDVTYRRLVLDEADGEVASQLLRSRSGPCGEYKKVAVLFSDIRGFTTLAQTLTPYDVMFALNRHFFELSEIVEANGGYIDNFFGDALMALFGVDGDERAPLRSVKAAVEMLAANDRMAPAMQAAYGHAFPIGIGVHYGEAVIGTLGASNRERLTAIGDTVNVASRIESANKEAGTRLLISGELYDLVKDDVVMQDYIRVKLPSVQERMSLYEISGIRPEALERDRAARTFDPTKRRSAGKTWTSLLRESELPDGGRRLVELEAFDVLLIRQGERVFAINNACPHLHLPLTAADVTDEGIIVCDKHHSCFDLMTGEVKAWCPFGLDPDGTSSHPVFKPLGRISKNRTPLTVFPVRVSEGQIWIALD
jgi:class 3 adenylate cyclase/nitrite reductase/ring-hydroxylating ferredoxin subunit